MPPKGGQTNIRRGWGVDLTMSRELRKIGKRAKPTGGGKMSQRAAAAKARAKAKAAARRRKRKRGGGVRGRRKA